MLQDYQHQGYWIERNLIPQSSIDALKAESNHLATRTDQSNLRYRFQNHLESGALFLDSIDPVADQLETARAISIFPSLTERLERLFGEPSCLFKDKLVLKPPGSPGYAPHQDFIAWPRFPKTFTTVLIALENSTPENGCLYGYQKSHLKGSLSRADGDFHDLPEACLEPESRIDFPLNAGDALFFGCFFVYGSEPNRSQTSRKHLYLTYNGLTDGGNQREFHYAYFRAWLLRRYGEYGSQGFYFQ